MKALLCIALAAFAAGCATTIPRNTRTDLTATVEQQILLTVRQPEGRAAGLTGAPSQRYFQRRYGPTPSVERVLSQLAREHDLDRVDGWPIESLEAYCEVFAVPAGRSPEEVIAALATDPRVDLVQRMNLFSTQTTKYNDPYADLQSATVTMEVEDAHQIATGRGVSVAIIDSAVDAAHPDLHGSVNVARNLVTAQPGGRRGEIHGTAVAGIIASAVNNSEGIIGVAPDVSLAALRACWAVTADSVAAQCSTFSLARALELALRLQPNVINLSLAGPADPLLARLLDVVIERGIVVVTARPETTDRALDFPSSHPQVFSAHSSVQAAHSDSPYVLAAPAREVLTTTPGAGYAFLTGNSLAAAHATGVIALLLEREPTIDAQRIATLLTATTTYARGSASINACRALARLTDTPLCAQHSELPAF
jgi:hypothetical protein